MNTVVTALILGFFLLVWLRTNAFVEYMRLFKLEKWLHVNEYTELERNGYEGNYVDFLVEYYKDKFFVRLLSCPICVSFWLGFINAVMFGPLHIVVAPLTLFVYLLFDKMI
jgi:hypothetical protein